MMIWIAAAVMVAATLMQHLGLTVAIGKVVTKVLGCYMCCTFWAVLGVLLWHGCGVLTAGLLAIIAAYASNWVALVLAWVDKKFDELWRRMGK